MIPASHTHPLLAAALAELAGAAVQGQPDRWKLALPGSASVEARVAGSWLVMTMPVPLACSAAHLLGCNALLPGWVKFAPGANGFPQVRAELPFDEALSGAAVIREALDGFRGARAVLHGKGPAAAKPEPSPAQAALQTLCAEAGWNAMPRGADAVAVELECRGAFRQALLGPSASGLRIAIDLAPGHEPEPAEAVARFLLDAASGVWMVRPAVETIEGKASPRFEFLFSRPPTAALLAHALSALSVACGLCAEEVTLLSNPDVAGEYLALRGGHATACGQAAT